MDRRDQEALSELTKGAAHSLATDLQNQLGLSCLSVPPARTPHGVNSMKRPSWTASSVRVFSLFRRPTESLARSDPAGSFRPHVPLLIPSGTPLSHGNAMELVTVLLFNKAVDNLLISYELMSSRGKP